MGSLSNYGEAALLDHLFNLDPYTPPTLYIALSTEDPGEDGAGLDEPSGNGYSRVQTASSDWSRSDSLVENAEELAFPEATGAWGVLTHVALMDASSEGNVVASAPLAQSREITENDTLRFPAGNIEFELD